MSALESFQLHLTSQNADKVNNNNNCDVEFYLPVIEIPSQFHIYVYNLKIYKYIYIYTHVYEYLY